MKVSLEVLSGPLDGHVFQFNKSVDIGRESFCDIAVPVDKYISRRHARLIVVEPECFLEDLASTNGTFVNDQRLHGRTVLSNGQLFKVGKTWVQIGW